MPVFEEEIVHQTAVLSSGTNVQNLVDALNAIGVAPGISSPYCRR